MKSKAVDQDFERVVAATQVLASDVQDAARLSNASDTPFCRRTYIRAAFALVEGTLNLMAEMILLAADRQEVTLKPEEVELLRQERSTTTDAGLAVVRIKFVAIRDRMAPVFEIFSRLLGQSYKVDKSGREWIDFTAAIDIRNRITHPKSSESFVISDSDLQTVDRARLWFADCIAAIITDSDWRC